MRIPTILAVSLAAVLVSCFLLVGPTSIRNIIPVGHDSHLRDAEAAAFPVDVRDRFSGKELAGDAAAGSKFMKVNEDFVDPEHHCEFCTRVEYTPGPEKLAGFAYEDLKGLDLLGAKKVRFWVMGEEGNEKIKFKVAGKPLDRVDENLGKLSSKLDTIFKSETFALTTSQLTLENKWKKYEIDLNGVNLKGITHPFGFELTGSVGHKEVVFIKGVVYDDNPPQNPIATTHDEPIQPLSAEIISNETAGVAPATFDFQSNVTGGTKPYSITWDFDDGTKIDQEKVSHTFEESGTYDVTLKVTDNGGQTALGNLEVKVVEPEATSFNNQTSTNNSLNETNIDRSNPINSTS